MKKVISEQTTFDFGDLMEPADGNRSAALSRGKGGRAPTKSAPAKNEMVGVTEKTSERKNKKDVVVDDSVIESARGARKNLRKGSAKLQEMADKTRKYELPKRFAGKEPEETLLHIKQENDEKKAYDLIAKGIEKAQKMLEIELKDLDGNRKLSAEQLKQKERQMIRHAKIAVKEIEKTNRLHIFTFKSTSGSWWKIGGNSVAIHNLMIATYLDREVKVNVDRDNFAIFRDGVICLQDAARIEKDIAYSGAPLTEDKTIDFGPFAKLIKAYRLNVSLSDREIRRFRKLDQEIMKSINNNIFSAAPESELNNSIIVALRDAFNLERALDANARGFVGTPLIDAMFRLRRAYYDVANTGRKNPLRYEAMQRVDEQVGDAMSALANYADLGIANRSAIARVSLELAKVRETARQKIASYNRKSMVGEKLEEIDEADGGEL